MWHSTHESLWTLGMRGTPMAPIPRMTSSIGPETSSPGANAVRPFSSSPLWQLMQSSSWGMMSCALRSSFQVAGVSSPPCGEWQATQVRPY